MIRWTGLAPGEFEFPFPGILTSTFPCSYMVALIWISKGKGDPKALFTLSSEALIRTAQVPIVGGNVTYVGPKVNCVRQVDF